MEKYELSILPLFESDMLEAITYITEVLNNPSAAERLIDETEKAIYRRLVSPLSFSPYKSKSREMMYITVFFWQFYRFLCG